MQMNKKPYMIMMMGLSGSGKSTLAKHISIDGELIRVEKEVNTTGVPTIHASDDLREELFGDVNHQADNDKLFAELHRRIKNDLRAGKHVIYDATNINKKLRIAFLSELKNIDCRKVCIAVMTPCEKCIANNANRERKVPNHVIQKMYKSWQPPHFHEGFDTIYFSFLQGDEDAGRHYRLDELFKTMMAFDQENEHHAKTLGEHCSLAYRYCVEKYPENINLQIAAQLHDIGKLETKVRVNSHGIDDGNCHYYQHHCVGAYLAAFYLSEGRMDIGDMVDVLNLIYFHMHPYGAWKQSEKALERDRRLLGDEMYENIIRLHEADLAAH